MNDEPSRLEVRPEGESGPATAGELLALHDQADGLRHLPSAVGVSVLALFFALFVFILKGADLGLLATLKVSLLVASPGLLLIPRDLMRARKLRRLEQRIAELEQRDDEPRLPSNPNAAADR